MYHLIFPLCFYWFLFYRLFKFFFIELLGLAKTDTKIVPSFSKESNKKLSYLTSCLISAWHSISVVIILLFMPVHQYDGNLFDIDDDNYKLLLTYSISYLIFDLIHSIIQQSYRKDDLMHHLIGIIGYIFGMYYHCGSFVGYISLWTECSTIFFMIYLIFNSLEKGEKEKWINKKLRLFIEYAFAITFFCCRIVFLSYWFWRLIYEPVEFHHKVIFFAFSSLCLLNMYWFKLILGNLVSRY